MSKESLIASLRTVPDYPKPGIKFWDVTTLFKNAAAFKEVEDILYEEYKDKGITKVAGIESRGFVMGAALASRLGAGFVLIRKPGKLPSETIALEYELERIGAIRAAKAEIKPEDITSSWCTTTCWRPAVQPMLP